MESYADYARNLVGLMAIVDPIGAVPLFIGLMPHANSQERKRTARNAAIAVAIILVGSMFAGEPVLRLFGISIPAFRVGGGILILLMALDMLKANHGRTRHTAEEDEEALAADSIAIVPLAIPLMAGPGAISLVIVTANRANDLFDVGALVVSCLVTAFSIWVCLRLASPIRRLLGATGINIATRVMGMILTAIGVELITTGTRELFPGLIR
ncbi:MAG: YchE family NAAT transporter [Bryobacterales bacterium]|jgi:multiple antibiotic resistance protein|nr:YchE family NAAT transporter [Bryobacterales bacterium]